MYAIHVVLHRTKLHATKQDPEGWVASRPLPLFYLDERVQGIVSVGAAEAIARDIVLPFGATDTLTASITAVQVEGADNYPLAEVAVLNIRFANHALSPAVFLSELEALEVTWDEDPVMIAAGRYEIEGLTSVLKSFLHRAGDTVAQFHWAPVE